MSLPLPRRWTDRPLLSTVAALPRRLGADARRLLLSGEGRLLAAVLGAAAGVRLFGLGAIGLNSDEAVYLGQAAALARLPGLEDLFPIFRAHPLLFQVALSLVVRLVPTDLAGRLIAVAIGLATVWITYRAGRSLYGPRVGLAAGAMLAFMPYHVVVSRQILLDVPMAFFATLTVYLLARFASTRRATWLTAAGASIGLTFLSKETGIVLLAAVYAFLALSASLQVRLRDLARATGVMALVILPYPLTLFLAGGLGAARSQQYLVWQLSRRPNHDASFYLNDVAPAIGVALIALALVGAIGIARRRSYRETLLASWVVVPAAFFQVWPVKGFHYLLLIAPPLALLAASTLRAWRPRRRYRLLRWAVPGAAIQTAAVIVVLLSFAAAWAARSRPTDGRLLAGSGGVPGGREAGLWLRANTPDGSTSMTIGPSMANILQFYGHRRALGLSVSTNPLHRNPAYEPIRNPDFALRTGDIHYVVWDAYSAARSSFFAEKLLGYARRYHGRVVHVESVEARLDHGRSVAKPVVIIYEVRP